MLGRAGRDRRPVRGLCLSELTLIDVRRGQRELLRPYMKTGDAVIGRPSGQSASNLPSSWRAAFHDLVGLSVGGKPTGERRRPGRTWGRARRPRWKRTMDETAVSARNGEWCGRRRSPSRLLERQGRRGLAAPASMHQRCRRRRTRYRACRWEVEAAGRMVRAVRWSRNKRLRPRSGPGVHFHPDDAEATCRQSREAVPAVPEKDVASPTPLAGTGDAHAVNEPPRPVVKRARRPGSSTCSAEKPRFRLAMPETPNVESKAPVRVQLGRSRLVTDPLTPRPRRMRPSGRISMSVTQAALRPRRCSTRAEFASLPTSRRPCRAAPSGLCADQDPRPRPLSGLAADQDASAGEQRRARTARKVHASRSVVVTSPPPKVVSTVPLVLNRCTRQAVRKPGAPSRRPPCRPAGWRWRPRAAGCSSAPAAVPGHRCRRWIVEAERLPLSDVRGR